MKNNLYVLGLMGMMTLSCGKDGTVAKTKNHNLQHLIGTYAGLVNGIQAEYEVREDSCYLTLHFPKRVVDILDQDCNYEADQVATPNPNYTGIRNKGLMDLFSQYNRGEFTESFKRDVDPWLREGWKLVKPENRVYRFGSIELESLFRP